tara:strand:+ start:12374 stop:12640 length:267 start_codon:yes stop_codon:yes gene_type:complete
MTNKKNKKTFRELNGGNSVFGRPFADVNGVIEFGKIRSKTYPDTVESIKKVCKYNEKDGELSLWIALDRYAVIVNLTRGYYYVHGYGS